MDRPRTPARPDSRARSSWSSWPGPNPISQLRAPGFGVSSPSSSRWAASSRPITQPASRPSDPDGIRNGFSVPRGRSSAMSSTLPQPGLRSNGRMLTVGQVATRLGLWVSSVHFYERRGLLPPVPRFAGQRRSLSGGR
ncbi:MerR family DNA-binding transcriptional regulator [Micromonospora sp. NPDC005806]|uniref:MerR family DNA-binding transcriptional regulator n=1 Tax=Micromonospora sp. NPDC005806 TaxID=3364234 RepID=UPI003695CA05